MASTGINRPLEFHPTGRRFLEGVRFTSAMKRREFLQFAALGAVPLLSPRTPVAGRDEVMTVLGPVAADRLGRTLMHEHVMVDFVGADKIRPGRYNPDEVFAEALPRLEELKAAGFALLSCGVFPFLHKFKDLHACLCEDE